MDGMSDMGGMDMGNQEMFTPPNMTIARLYWYLVAASIGVVAFRPVFEYSRAYLL